MNLGLLGTALALGIAAIGSAIGIGTAGSASIGAWKKCYMTNKAAPFILTVFAGAPLSQTIYAMVLMMIMNSRTVVNEGQVIFYLLIGVFAGVALMLSAFFQGKAGAAACDAFGETNKGFANDLMVLGVVETVALFALVFAIMVL
jgi:V/A-type H+-transporting ATPase subunit K